MKKIDTISQLLKEISNINIRTDKNEKIKNPYYDQIIDVLKNFKINELNYYEIKSKIFDLSQNLRYDKKIDTNKEFMPILEKINIVIKFLDEQEKKQKICNDWNLIVNLKSETESENILQQKQQTNETTLLLANDINSINSEQIAIEQKCFKCCAII